MLGDGACNCIPSQGNDACFLRKKRMKTFPAENFFSEQTWTFLIDNNSSGQNRIILCMTADI